MIDPVPAVGDLVGEQRLGQLVTSIGRGTWAAAGVMLLVASYALHRATPMWVAMVAIAAIAAAILAAAVDYTAQTLPDLLTYPLAAVGLGVFLLLQFNGIHSGLLNAVLGGLVYAGGMLLLAMVPRRPVFLLGDIKLVAGLGIWAGGLAGWIGVYLVVLFGLALVAVAGAVAKRRSGSGVIAAGPGLVAGWVLAFLIL